MIRDPAARGRALARLYADLTPLLYRDLETSGALSEPRGEARLEWDCFASYACVRALLAAGGFDGGTAAAIDAFHDAAIETLDAEPRGPGAMPPPAERRALLARRYEEYGTVGRESAADRVAERLGEAAARHLVAGAPSPELVTVVAALHEALVEGAEEFVRRGAPE